MAGSYKHMINHKGDFIGTRLIDSGRDTFEALEECYDMIQYMANGDPKKIYEAWLHGHLAKSCPSNVPLQKFEEWMRDKDAEDYAGYEVYREAALLDPSRLTDTDLLERLEERVKAQSPTPSGSVSLDYSNHAGDRGFRVMWYHTLGNRCRTLRDALKDALRK